MSKKKSRKKKYIAHVNGAIFRHLVGKNVKQLPEVHTHDRTKKKFFFFSNSRYEHDPQSILKKVERYAKEDANYCFGVFEMKNNKLYCFICKLDLLYINKNLTHIHTKPMIEFSGKF